MELVGGEDGVHAFDLVIRHRQDHHAVQSSILLISTGHPWRYALDAARPTPGTAGVAVFAVAAAGLPPARACARRLHHAAALRRRLGLGLVSADDCVVSPR